MQLMGAAHEIYWLSFMNVEGVRMGKLSRIVVVCARRRKRAVATAAGRNVREPDGEVVIIDSFEVVLVGVEVDRGDAVFAYELVFGIAAVVGIGLEAERGGDVGKEEAT